MDLSALRDIALSRALQTHDYNSKADTIVDTAKTFEAYLAGRSDTSPLEGRPVASGSPSQPDPDQEEWRMRIERLPYDGRSKINDSLTGDAKLAYRIEVLAQIVLVDVNEDPRTREAALDELMATVNDLPTALTNTDPAE